MCKCIQWLCIHCLLILPIICPAQEWVARYNGPIDGSDQASSIALDGTGNICVTGGSYGFGTSSDYTTIKYNSSGFEQWVVRYNGPDNWYDIAEAITIDDAGAIYVTGSSFGSGTNRDYATVKYDSAGVEQWVARYNGPGNGEEWAYAMVGDETGAIYVTGYSYDPGSLWDYATIKYNSDGIEQWVARYDGPLNIGDVAYAIAVDDAGGIYVTGNSWELNQYTDYTTVKYDSTGIEQWVARYNGPGSYYDYAWAIAVDGACNIYITGGSFDSVSNFDYATVKYDSAGIEQWAVRYNSSSNDTDYAYAVTVDNAHNVYVTGVSYDSGTSADYATVKYDSAGVEQWVARYNGPANGEDLAYEIVVDETGAVYVSGRSYGIGTHFDYATVKYDSAGVEQWVARYNGPGNLIDGPSGMVLNDVNDILITGYSSGDGTGSDYTTIKYLPTGIEECRINQIISRDIRSTIFSGPLKLPKGEKCKVFDITGRQIKPDKIQPGIYFVEVDGVVTQKVVKVR